VRVDCLCRVIVFFSSRRRHTRSKRDWSSDVCSDLLLSGALTCGVCNTPKKMGSTGPRKYRCRSCNNSISKEIDKLVEKIVLVRLRDWQPDPEQVDGLDLSEENRK